MCMHIAKKLGAEGAKKHSLTDQMEFRKKSIRSKEVYWKSSDKDFPLIIRSTASATIGATDS